MNYKPNVQCLKCLFAALWCLSSTAAFASYVPATPTNPSQPQLLTTPNIPFASPSKSTSLYVTEFANPADTRPGTPSGPAGSDPSTWMNNPGQMLQNFQLLTNNVTSQFGIGIQTNI